MQYDNNRETAKPSVLLPGEKDKYEFLAGEEILPSNQNRIIEQAKFTNSPVGKVEALKSLKSEENKQSIKSIEVIFMKFMRTNEVKNKINEIKKWGKNKQTDSKYETKNTYLILGNMKQ